MIGAVLTHQQPLQQIIGVYYILQVRILNPNKETQYELKIQDIALMGQFIYYKRFYHSGLTFGNPLNRSNIRIIYLFVTLT
jgi:hypothetical protein